jgi:hypothetical protein
MIGYALITDKHKGGLGAAFDLLEARLRRYATALSDHDRADVRAYLNARMDTIVDLLNQAEAPDRVWSEDE